MPSALITGAAGFVGRHFTRHLREAGWRVCPIDVAVLDGNPDNVIRWDARDYFRESADDVSYDLVLHCAAVVGGRQVIDGNPLAQAVNLELDAAMFAWAMRTRPGRVIYFSSSAAYPEKLQDGSLRHKLTEKDINLAAREFGMPDQLYGWAKLTGELLARRAVLEGLAVTVVRPFSGYGEDQDACYPFPAFIDRALRREDPFIVWGHGQQVRDFIHIDDIVASVLKMFEWDDGETINLGSGIPVSMLRLAGYICEAAGYDPEFETVPTAPAGVSYRVADTDMQRRFCGAPKVTLEEGISRALKYRSAL